MNAFARVLGIVLAVAMIALPVVALMNGWIGGERFPLTTLRLASDARRVDAAAVQKIVAPYARQGYFAIDLEQAQRELAGLPWVESAEVSRRWPDVLEVRIHEHRPLALWDETLLLSERGRLYPRAAMGHALPKDLPQLGGDPRQVATVLAFYNRAREWFAPLGVQVHELRQDARGSWSLRLSDGTRVLVGRQAPETRVQRFVELLPKLIAPPGSALERADLRYANGFALKWREPAPSLPPGSALPRKTA